MEWIVIFALGVALYRLWRRVERLEARLGDLDVHDTPADTVLPAPATATVPIIRKKPATASAPARATARIVGSARAVAGLAPPRRAEARDRSFSINFEELFGRQLPIWAGGITLAIAGFFLVAYAIDQGLLSPAVRVFLGFAFGAALIGGAFVAERMRERIADPRVTQALAGAGIATLYACFYLAGTGYGLIGSGVAFAGLAATTAGAVWLSFRFGIACAVLGLVGGFAAPMMVASDEASLPVLSVYLALVSGGLALTGQRQQRPWLGIAALVGGLLWGVPLLLGQQLGLADNLFVGFYLIAVGAVLPAVVGDLPARRWLRAGAGAFAALQMAVLIDRADYAMLGWGLFVLLGSALAALAWREKALREASVLGSAIGVLLLAFWPNPDVQPFALIAAAFALLFAAVPLAHVWLRDESEADVVQLAGAAPGIALGAIWHFGDFFHDFLPLMALVLLMLASLPALAAWRLSARDDWRRHLLEVSAAVTGVLAVSQLVDESWGAAIIALAAMAMAFALPRRVAAARTLLGFAAAFAVYPLAQWLEAGVDALSGEPFLVTDLVKWPDTLRYLVPAVAAGAVVAWRQFGHGSRRVGQVLAVISGVWGVVALHSFYKLGFAIRGPAGFAALGLAERTVWDALLIGAAFVLWQATDRVRHSRVIAAALGVTALAHFVWFTLIVHNPLWSAQAVGPMPVANLALASFAVAIAGIVLLRRVAPADWRCGFDIAIMALLPILAITLLRQVFSGSLLTIVPMGQGEDLLRSLSGIVLAIGYLLWGAQSEDRTWRIGSLVLMLLAVGKVFLADAAVLGGLARVGSFLALGFSLIGIGWFYSRILSRQQVRPAPEGEVGAG